ncbi:MAG: DegV family protein [Lachnospiraceae bacterium]
MNRKPLRITTDSVCDLPFGMLEEYDIDVIFFHIVTENGRFLDRDEMTADNVFEHMDNGGFKAESESPSIQEYVDFFRKNLRKYEKIIHITIGGNISKAYKNAAEAILRMGNNGERVLLVDSETLSTGMGLLAVSGAEMVRKGLEANTIFRQLELMKKRISTTFIVPDLMYFYLNDKTKLLTVKIFDLFQLHPVLTIKDGKIKLMYIAVGNYQNAIRRYVKWRLKRISKIDKKRVFLTHAACNVKTVANAKQEIENCGGFEDIILTKASATISSNCGPGALGVLFMKTK